VGVIAREVERAGIVTTSISLVKHFTQQVKPPRALWVPFPFGRPLGAPNDPEIQRRVLIAALDLCERSGGAVLEDFALPQQYEHLDAKHQTVGRKCGPKGCDLDEILAASAAGSSTDPAAAHYDNDFDALRAEIAELASAHRRYRERYQNRTQVGQSGVKPETIVQAAQIVHDFVRGDTIVPPTDGRARSEASTPNLFIRLSIDDLKAFYLESRLVLDDRAANDAASANDWLWLDTRAGALIVAARDRLIETTNRDEDPNWILARGIVPRGYGSSGYTMTHVLEKS